MTPVLDVRFDIGKLESTTGSPAYGSEAWRVFWSAVDLSRLSAANLRDGDTAATLSHQENAFCIEVQATPAALQETKTALATSARFSDVAASPPFLEAEEPSGDPLVDAGRIVEGQMTGGDWAATAPQAAHPRSRALPVAGASGPPVSATAASTSSYPSNGPERSVEAGPQTGGRPEAEDALPGESRPATPEDSAGSGPWKTPEPNGRSDPETWRGTWSQH